MSISKLVPIQDFLTRFNVPGRGLPTVIFENCVTEPASERARITAVTISNRSTLFNYINNTYIQGLLRNVKKTR